MQIFAGTIMLRHIDAANIISLAVGRYKRRARISARNAPATFPTTIGRAAALIPPPRLSFFFSSFYVGPVTNRLHSNDI
jgi:hypothetical protein